MVDTMGKNFEARETGRACSATQHVAFGNDDIYVEPQSHEAEAVICI